MLLGFCTIAGLLVILHLYIAVFLAVWIHLSLNIWPGRETTGVVSQIPGWAVGGWWHPFWPCSQHNKLRRWELMSFSCQIWQALICFHSASHHGFKDGWFISLRGGVRRSTLPPKMTGIQKFLTQGDLAPHNWLLHSVNHCRVMTHYSAWKTSLSILCRGDSITHHFLLVNKTALLKDVLFVVPRVFVF